MKNIILRRLVAFTLIEMLVVMGIIVLMGSLIVPAVSGSLKGTALNQSSQTLLAAFNNAQQTALAKGQTMELRVFLTLDPDASNASTGTPPTPGQANSSSPYKIRAVQLYAVQTNPNPGQSAAALIYTPLTKLDFLPSSIIIDSGTTLSSLCNATAYPTLGETGAPTTSVSPTHPSLPRVKTNYSYYKIDFRADGTTSLNPNVSWFLTLHALSSGDVMTSPPSNFYTVELDPVQGSTRSFRPM